MALSKIKPAVIKSRVAATKGLRDRKRVLFNTSNKATQDLFNKRLARTDRLRTFRERQSARIRQVNQSYLAQTQNVLNDKTLDFLVKHSNIDAPTFTSIFAGFELARASRADRLNLSRESEIKRLESQSKLLQNEIALADKVDVAKQKNLEAQLKNNIAVLDDLQSNIEDDVVASNKSAQDVVDQEQTLEGIDTRFNNQTTLQNDRQSFSQSERVAGQTFRAGEQDERISSQTTLQNDRQSFSQSERKAKQDFRLNNPGVFRKGTDNPDARSFIDGLDIDEPETDIDNPTFVPSKPILPPEDLGEDTAFAPLDTDTFTTDDQQPLVTDVTVNGETDDSFIGKIFDSNEQFTEALALDNDNPDTPDVLASIQEGQSRIFVNPGTGETVVVLEGQSPPDGFVENDEVIA